MIWLFVLASGLATFVIAAVSVGSVTAQLATQPRLSAYNLADAVEFVADDLPDDLTAELTYEEVGAVLGAHLDFLEAKGVATQRAGQHGDDHLVLVGDDEVIARVLEALDAEEFEISDESVVAILESEQRYISSIGAIGPAVELPT